jgi:hypothetical protein
MNKQEALLLLGVSDENDWKDHLAHQVFEIKQFVLKSYHPPAVLLAKSKKIVKWVEAASFLTENTPTTLLNHISAEKLPQLTTAVEDLLRFYRTYEHLLTSLKLQLLQTGDPYTAAQILENLAHIEENRHFNLAELCHLCQLTPRPTDVKLSEFVNSGEIVRSLLPHQNKLLTKALVYELPLLNRELDKSVKFSNFTKN